MRTLYQRGLQAIIILDVIVLAVFGTQTFFTHAPQQPDGDGGAGNGIVAEHDIDVRWTHFFTSSQDAVDIAALLYNPNTDLGARLFRYTFTLSNNDAVVDTVSGTSYILPEAERLVVLPRVRPGSSVSDISIEISDVHWEYPEEFRSSPITVRAQEFEQPTSRSGFAARAAGIVRNNSLVGLRDIDIAVAMRDAQGNIVGVNKSDTQTVLPQEERLTELFWPQELPAATSDPQFFLSSNIFNPDNIIRPGSDEFIQLQHELENRQNR
jgi:hypothetical protein